MLSEDNIATLFSSSGRCSELEFLVNEDANARTTVAFGRAIEVFVRILMSMHVNQVSLQRVIM